MADSTKSPQLRAEDLETPVLKTSIVTTGRGGTGNMARNTDPKETRALQDVEPVARRPSQGAAHAGRGGAGNVFKQGSAEAEAAAHAAAGGSAVADDAHHGHSHEHERGLAAKGKDWLLGKRS